MINFFLFYRISESIYKKIDHLVLLFLFTLSMHVEFGTLLYSEFEMWHLSIM